MLHAGGGRPALKGCHRGSEGWKGLGGLVRLSTVKGISDRFSGQRA